MAGRTYRRDNRGRFAGRGGSRIRAKAPAITLTKRGLGGSSNPAGTISGTRKGRLLEEDARWFKGNIPGFNRSRVKRKLTPQQKAKAARSEALLRMGLNRGGVVGGRGPRFLNINRTTGDEASSMGLRRNINGQIGKRRGARLAPKAPRLMQIDRASSTGTYTRVSTKGTKRVGAMRLGRRTGGRL